MFVAREGHSFGELPTIALDTRWSMTNAASFTAQIEENVAEIAPVLETVRLKKIRNVAPESNATPSSNATSSSNPMSSRNANTATLPAYSSRTSQVSFVRLTRNERSAHVILTHAEKYNIARSVFDPVIDRLTSLSSPKFYKQIQMWEEMITKFTDSGATGSSLNNDTNEDRTSNSDSDYESGLDADDDILDLGDVHEVEEGAVGGGSADTEVVEAPTLPSPLILSSATQCNVKFL
ncbi:hypothetical protein V7S43_007577 [Phytophthora oleae]|uniref:Uncharacterized protein n=1 Tax=Phytophthora oleae TaxID=2107226 RepID=A0ABD3FLZ9_9STRA